MNKLKYGLVMVLLSLIAACDSTPTTNQNNSDLWEQFPIIVNVPEVIGKTPKQVVTLLGEPAKEFGEDTQNLGNSGPKYDAKYEYIWGYVEFKGERAVLISVSSRDVYKHPYSVLSRMGITNIPENIKILRETRTARVFRDVELHGITFKEIIVLARKDGEFYMATFLID